VVTVSWLYSFFGGTNEKAMLVSDIILFFSPQFSHQPADHKMWRKWIAPSARYFLSTLTCALSSQVNDVKMVQSINIFCASMADCWDIKELPEEKEATSGNGIGFGGLL